jgi:2-phosphosulfolactate phosphatase
MRDLDIFYLPEQWHALEIERLGASACAVIDVIRATSTIATALAHGALGVQPVTSVPDAFVLKALNPDSLLAGERGGRPLPGFDLGNSPGDFTPERVAGKRIILTTTQRHRRPRRLPRRARCRSRPASSTSKPSPPASSNSALPGSSSAPDCEGQFGIDDAIVAGALAEALGRDHPLVSLYHSVRDDLTQTLQTCVAGRELLKVGMEKDIPFCAQQNIFHVAPTWADDGLASITCFTFQQKMI